MSDSVADSGRGASRVAPSLVGGPQDCDGSWSPQFIIYLLGFCILLSCGVSFLFHDLSLSEFRMSLVIPGRHQVRFSRSILK